MASKLLIILSDFTQSSDDEAKKDEALDIVEPIYYSIIAASMDYQVELIFTGRAGKFAVKGEAVKIQTQRRKDETIYDLIKDAYQSGVVLKASKFVVQRFGDNLIPEISEIVSGGYIVGEAMNPEIKTLTY